MSYVACIIARVGIMRLGKVEPRNWRRRSDQKNLTLSGQGEPALKEMAP